MDESLASDVLNSSDVCETSTSSVGSESVPLTSRRGIYSRTGLSDIMEYQTEMMKLRKEKFDKDAAFKEKEMQIKEQELSLRRAEFDMKQKEFDSRERFQILKLQSKERVAMEELRLKYRSNSEF